MKPGTLATKAINQYRARDLIPYLALRYYLDSTCARSDRWASEIAVHLTQTCGSPAYFEAHHFKETNQDGSVLHRSIFLPGPGEALAETVLLAECSKYDVFDPLPCVYSYRLAKSGDGSGIFEPYFNGFRQRHRDVAAACRDLGQGGVVVYTDIKRFYPTIRSDQASRVWSDSTLNTSIPKHLSELGHKLLDAHSQVCTANKLGHGILTGPMFSHLIANQLLRSVDEVMSALFPNRYFRYVDDVILIGTAGEVKDGKERLGQLLSDLHLELHADDAEKTFSVDTGAWLTGENDFDESDGRAWMFFVGDLRRFLVSKPDEQQKLAVALSSEGFNIPLPNYLAAASESGPMQRLTDFLKRYRWAGKSIKQISVSWLVAYAKALRIVFEERLTRLLQIQPDVRGYDRKRLIPKLRYFGGRMLYLGTPEMQKEYAQKLAYFPELHLLATVLEAVAARDVSRLVSLGSNAVQSAAQVLRLSPVPVRYCGVTWGRAELQGLSILKLNGVKVSPESERPTLADSLSRFSDSNVSMSKLMRDSDPYVRELACLHGAGSEARHSQILNTAFDRDEQLAFDVLNQLSQSGYD